MIDRAGWSIVIPVKGGDTAKSRLGADSRRLGLAGAFALDTVRVVVGSEAVRDVLVVTDPATGRAFRALGARVVPDPGRGLVAAISAGLEAVSGARSGAAILLGDLPALRSDDLTEFLSAARLVPAAIAADANGTGTSISTARSGSRHRVRFGADSRRRHRQAGYVDLTHLAPASLRSDVDTPDDLAIVRRLRVGRSTTAVLSGS